MIAAGLASIPSPSTGTLEIGPISLNAYGLMIALGVVAGVWLFGRRLEEKRIGTREDANAIAVWGVAAGVVGARLYHVITDWDRFEGNLGDVVKIWEGGLGIPGGMLAGVLVGAYVGHRRGIPLGPGLNAVAPSLPLAQAIGRWGNWFNQELFGRPTDLPWALEIDDEHLPPGYESGTTFHPTFLYESLWSLGLCGLLLWIDRRFRPAGGRLLAMYVLGYGVGRFWVEGLRIDEANEIAGLRVNQWVALAAVVGGGAYLLATWNKPRDPLPAVAAEPAGAGQADVDALDDDVADTVPHVADLDDEVVEAEVVEEPTDGPAVQAAGAAGERDVRSGADDDIVEAEIVADHAVEPGADGQQGSTSTAERDR